MDRLFPRPLPPSATIGITSPASPQRDQDRLVRGISVLRDLGYTVIEGATCTARAGSYLAGSDELRARELEAMFADPSIDAIMCARGGYGSPRILDLIDWSIIANNPKIFVGFSDITALQMAMLHRTGLVTFSGAMPSVDMADGFDPLSAASFWNALTSTSPLGTISQPEAINVLRPGKAEGLLVGGNLSVFVSLLGTPWLPPMDGNVLILEDIGEETYRIDRMLNHLRLAGVLDRISALVFGQWSQGTVRESNTPPRDVNDVLLEYAQYVDGPVLSNVMYGHVTPKLTLPMGVRVSVEETIRVEECASVLVC
ncbi:MAG: LD-carboxypeptidase [Ignavibacteriae bacterium]|nr:MAG: LD-carboxypeptidase [Ignavibacteriota bacterium]